MKYSKLHGLLFSIPIAVYSTAAAAAHWEVVFDSSTVPPDTNIEDIESDIQQVLRQWEHFSSGKANFRWGGSIPGATCTSGRMLIRFGQLPPNSCAYNDPGTLVLGACSQITIANTVNGTTGPRPRRHPNLLGIGARCVDLQGTLHHEIAHAFHNVPNSHAANSVRSPCSNAFCVQDSHVRHLWTWDMVLADPVWYPPRTLGLAHASFYPSTLGEWGEELTTHPDFHFAAAAISTGSLVHADEYAWVFSREQSFTSWTSANGLYFAVGSSAASPNASVWMPQTEHSEHATRHPLCLSSNGLGEYLLAWASKEQSAWAMDGEFPNWMYRFSGARGVFFRRSFDGGRTWSAVLQHPTASTRAGISCAYDSAQGQHVLLFTGSQDEGLWLSSLPEGSGGPWTPAQQLGIVPGRSVVPTTTDAPSIDFDEYGSGAIAWYDNIDRGSAVGLNWNASAGTYTWNASAVSAATSTMDNRQLRSRIVLLQYSPHRQVLYNLNPTQTQRRRVRAQLNPARIEMQDNNFSTVFRSSYAGVARSAFGIGQYRALSFTWNGAE